MEHILELANTDPRYLANKHYFELINNVYVYAASAFKSENNKILQNYLEQYQSTLKALKYKYLYSFLDSSSDCVKIDFENSGLPHKSELRYLISDRENIDAKIGKLGSIESIRHDLIKKALHSKQIPFHEMKKLSERLYLQEVEKGLFFEVFKGCSFSEILEPNFDLTKNQKAVKIHWSFYSSQYNNPVVFIVEAAVDTISDDLDHTMGEISKLFTDVAKSCDSSTEVLMSIGSRIDDKIERLHPKKISRISLGNIYSAGITSHGNKLEEILSEISDPESNWLYSWVEEHLFSNGSVSHSGGILSGKKVRESWFRPEGDAKCIENGCSAIKTNLIIPYKVYQLLVDRGEEILMGTNKFVIDKRMTIVKL